MHVHSMNMFATEVLSCFEVLKAQPHWCALDKPDLSPASYFQIVSPIDKGIFQSILDNLKPVRSSWDTSVLTNNPMCKDPYQEVLKEYNAAVTSLCHHRFVSRSACLWTCLSLTAHDVCPSVCPSKPLVCGAVLLSVCLSILRCIHLPTTQYQWGLG